jgi:putative mycofactocin binding protein MftB
MDRSLRYRLGRGFSFRREDFGGILFHYEGVRPDPRVTLVDSPFLIDLLELLRDHPERSLDGLLSAVRDHFRLNAAQQAALERFFTTLTERGALVPCPHAE